MVLNEGTDFFYLMKEFWFGHLLQTLSNVLSEKSKWMFLLINEKFYVVLKKKSFCLSFTILKRVGVFRSLIFGRLSICLSVSGRDIWMSKNRGVTPPWISMFCFSLCYQPTPAKFKFRSFNVFNNLGFDSWAQIWIL